MKLLQFEIDGRRWAMLPLDCYDELCEALEDAADAEAMRQAEANGGETFPSSFVERLLLSGEKPRVSGEKPRARLARVPRTERR